MRELSTTVYSIIEGNSFLKFGISKKMLNLTQVSKYILPVVNARLGREVSSSSVTMALSRFSERVTPVRSLKKFYLQNLFVTGELAICTWSNTPQLRRELQSIFTTIHRQGGYMTITQGVKQITAIVDRRFYDKMVEKVSEDSIASYPNISAVGASFKESYSSSPGFFAAIFQNLFFQNINIIEVASTSTELVLYLRDKDVRLAFDTLYQGFVERE